jgi:hypothetical protein
VATSELNAISMPACLLRGKKMEPVSLTPLQELQKILKETVVTKSGNNSLALIALVAVMTHFTLFYEEARNDADLYCATGLVIAAVLKAASWTWNFCLGSVEAQSVKSFETNVCSLVKRLAASSKEECFEIINLLSSFNLKATVGQTSAQVSMTLALSQVFVAAQARLKELEKIA